MASSGKLYLEGLVAAGMLGGGSAFINPATPSIQSITDAATRYETADTDPVWHPFGTAIASGVFEVFGYGFGIDYLENAASDNRVHASNSCVEGASLSNYALFDDSRLSQVGRTEGVHTHALPNGSWVLKNPAAIRLPATVLGMLGGCGALGLAARLARDPA